MNAIIICLVCLIGMFLGVLTWFVIPCIKLNHLIVWINRNNQINHCDWISDSFQSLLCLIKSKQYLEENFVLVRTKNKVTINSIFSFRIDIELIVIINGAHDGNKIDEISENFAISLLYKNSKWFVAFVEQMNCFL